MPSEQQPVVVRIPLDVNIKLADRDGTLADLKPGDSVTVVQEAKDGANTAKLITVKRP